MRTTVERSRPSMFLAAAISLLGLTIAAATLASWVSETDVDGFGRRGCGVGGGGTSTTAGGC